MNQNFPIEEKSDQTNFGGLTLKESDMDDRFFCDKDDAPVDMEEVREGMKLVPLPDICYADEANDPIHTEDPYSENVVPLFQAVASDDFRDQDLVVKKVRPAKITAGKRKIGGASRGLLKRMKANLLVKDSRTKAFSKLSVREVSRNIQTGGIVPEDGPFPDFSLWTVEDDLLLKNSMEAGAAMEALAKGAMRFSRCFTITELRGRWRALLYDPEIAAKAAARMVEAEALILGSSKPFSSKHKDLQATSKKRRNRSVRTEYYKRRRNLAEEHAVWSLMNGSMQHGSRGPNVHACTQAGETTEGHSVAVDVTPFLTVCIESPHHCCSKEAEALNIQDQTCAEMVCPPASEGVETVIESRMLVGIEDTSKKSDVLAHDNCLLSNYGCNLNETTEALDVVSPEVVCESNQSVPVSLLQGVPISEPQEAARDIKDAKVPYIETAAANSCVGKICEAACVQESAELPLKVQDTVLDPGLKKYGESAEIASDALFFAENPHSRVSDLCAFEIQECFRRTTINHEFTICTLNTEDTDVPDFEDPPSPSMSSSSSLGSSGYQSGSLSKLRTQAEVFESSHSMHAAEESVENIERMRDDEHNNAMSNFCSTNLCEESIKSQFVGPMSKLAETKEGSVKKRGKNSPRRSSSVNLMHSSTELMNSYFTEAQANCNTTTNSVTFRFQTEKGACLAKCGTSLHEPFILDSAFGAPLNTSTSNMLRQKTSQLDGGSSDAELQISQDKNGEEDSGKQKHLIEDEPLSDEELAPFSDVEALILDMDLDPGDDDFSARAESRHTYKSHRKTLIRLEQAANSAMQRALMSRGAIAILYGHHLRYFMTKNEVIIGRFTQDNVVDIDLGKEGRANKVSRRQASIKLKEDGVFYLKNLGRRVLYVNNIVVETSQRASLNSACLIEVGGMRFIFEINKKLVKKRIKEMISSSYDE